MASQSHQPTFYLLKLRVPASESPHLLGRVISHYQDPTLDFTPQSPSQSLTTEKFSQFLLGPQYDESAHLVAQASQDDKLGAKIKGLLSLSSGSNEAGMTEVTSSRITTRRLKLEGDYFNALKAVPEVRRKILDMCPVGRKAYLIVGTMSIQKATFKQKASQRNVIGASASLAVGIGAAIGGVPLPANVTDPEVHAEYSKSSNWTKNFSATASTRDVKFDEAAEEVFAIACKEISRKWEGFGKDVKMKVKRVEYRGGQHFGKNDESDSDFESEDDDDEQVEAAAAQSLSLVETSLEKSAAGSDFFKPVLRSNISS